MSPVACWSQGAVVSGGNVLRKLRRGQLAYQVAAVELLLDLGRLCPLACVV
jgi:hypothetical protein